MNLNNANIIGRVTRDPEVKALPSGMQVCSFSMATNRVWKNKEGAKQESTTFHNMVAFGKQAETIGQYVKKGQLLLVQGRIETRSWEDKETKKKMYRTEIIVENFQFGPKAAGTSERSQADEDFDNTGSDDGEDINPEDIPF